VVLLPDEKTWIKQKEEKFAAKAKQEANERAAARAALREEAAAARATTREPGSQPSSRPGSPPHEESSKHGKGGKSGAPPKPAMVKAESLVENEGYTRVRLLPHARLPDSERLSGGARVHEELVDFRF
jgi:hypothetical protein